jgi:uncharacterized protein YerC
MSAAESKNVKTWDARRQRFHEMFCMCLEGKTLSEIGEHYGISKQAVSSFLKCNANSKEFEIIQESFTKRMTSVQNDAEVMSKVQDGWSYSKIAKHFGCHVSSIKRAAARWRKSNASAA